MPSKRPLERLIPLRASLRDTGAMCVFMRTAYCQGPASTIDFNVSQQGETYLYDLSDMHVAFDYLIEPAWETLLQSLSK